MYFLLRIKVFLIMLIMFNNVKCFWDGWFQKYIQEENLVFSRYLVNLKYSGNTKEAEVFPDKWFLLWVLHHITLSHYWLICLGILKQNVSMPADTGCGCNSGRKKRCLKSTNFLSFCLLGTDNKEMGTRLRQKWWLLYGLTCLCTWKR